MFKELSHKTFAVGGSIRNELLGKAAKDFDFVVADTTEEEFLAIFPEAKKVGNSFPVYLLKDAEGNEHEIALARSEKSTGVSYTDFEFVSGVSIEEDLSRRDFTINSIARNVHTGELVDPHNGHHDLIHSRLRTININAFIDDSLRIYRGLRFACEFDFTIEENTLELMKASVGSLIHIPLERVDLVKSLLNFLNFLIQLVGFMFILKNWK
jgi:tRNA nucleotidyltransferase (CCA-adding enzyme)